MSRRATREGPETAVKWVRWVAGTICLAIIVAMCIDSTATMHMFVRFFSLVARLL